MEYEFECEEVEVGGIKAIASGTVEFDIEDTAIGYVPYGDTYAWHPGGGIQPTDVKVTSLKEFYVEPEDVDIAILVNTPQDKLWDVIAEQIDLDGAVDDAIESAKEEAALAKAGL